MTRANEITLDGALTLPGDTGEAKWLADLRERSLASFQSLGVPTRRDEEWKYTNLRAIAEQSWMLPESGPSQVPSVDQLAVEGVEGPQFVFVNGHFDQRASCTEELPKGLTVSPLGELSGDMQSTVAESLGRHTRLDDAPFAALNSAMFADVAVIHAAQGVVFDAPVKLLFVSTSPHATPTLSSPRTLLIAEPGSHVDVFQQYVSGDDHLHLTNSITEAIVREGATARVHALHLENEHAYHITTTTVYQESRSRFALHSALLGNALIRNDANPILDGEEILSTLNGIYIGRGTEHMDNHMRVEHRKPNCESRQYYRGVLADRSRGVFTGRIIVSQEAQKTDAVQSCQNLLLSESAQAQTRPQLEIYADDVKCTHGATTGEIDDDALFYLRARGLSERQARDMLVHAFVGEGLGHIEHEAIATAFEVLVHGTLNTLSGETALSSV